MGKNGMDEEDQNILEDEDLDQDGSWVTRRIFIFLDYNIILEARSWWMMINIIF